MLQAHEDWVVVTPKRAVMSGACRGRFATRSWSRSLVSAALRATKINVLST
jgi:hypothetical protein